MIGISPYFIGFFAIVCYAALSPIAKKLQLDAPPFAFIGITMGIMCVFASIISFYFEKDFSLLKVSPKAWIGLVIFTLINLVGFAFYLNAISRIPITHYQLLGLITPIVGGTIAYVLLGENFKMQYLYGLIFIGIGLFIALRGGTN